MAGAAVDSESGEGQTRTFAAALREPPRPGYSRGQRRLAVLACLLVAGGIGVLRWLGQWAGWYGTAVGTAGFVVVVFAAFCC
jgi:hypothetical protein